LIFGNARVYLYLSFHSRVKGKSEKSLELEEGGIKENPHHLVKPFISD